MANEKFKFEADVAGFVKAKDQVKTGLDQIEKKAVETSRTVEKASVQMEASMKRAARAGGASGGIGGGAGAGGMVVAAGGGARGRSRVLKNAYRGMGGTAIGTAAAGALAGRGAGALGGRAIGGALGAVGGVPGAIVGSIIGSGIAGMLGGNSEPSEEEVQADQIKQLVMRGFSEPAAKAVEQMSRDFEAKFQIDSERIQAAVVEAQAGDASAIRSILEDIGINPSTVQTINDALAKMAEMSAGAAKEQKERDNPLGAALDRVKETREGAGVTTFFSEFASGVASAPGEMFTNILNSLADALDRNPRKPEDARRDAGTPEAAPTVTNNAPLNKPEKLGRGDMRIIVGSPKNVPTMVKRTGGR